MLHKRELSKDLSLMPSERREQLEEMDEWGQTSPEREKEAFSMKM